MLLKRREILQHSDTSLWFVPEIIWVLFAGLAELKEKLVSIQLEESNFEQICATPVHEQRCCVRDNVRHKSRASCMFAHLHGAYIPCQVALEVSCSACKI